MTGGESIILTYHSLDDSGSVISIAPRLFREQMKSLQTSGLPVVSLEQVRTAPGSVALTFDDGYRNFLDCALPVLAEAGFPATVFAVTGFCGLVPGWSGQRASVPALPLMSW